MRHENSSRTHLNAEVGSRKLAITLEQLKSVLDFNTLLIRNIVIVRP
jgi:hypothetical protein